MNSSPTPDNSLPTPAAIEQGGPSVVREMAKGTGWMVAARLSVQAIGFLSTIILARLLVPADFGLVALATSFSVALQSVSEFSFDLVLIQNQQASKQHYDTAWTLSLLRNLLLAACLVVGARWIAELYGDERLEAVIYWLAASTVADGFQNIGVVDFRKDLAFHRDLIFSVLGKLSGFVVTIPLAFLWHDYWALVAGIVVGTFLRLILSFVMHHHRPRLTFAKWRELMHFSKWLVLNNIAFLLSSRSDTFILGKFSGAQAVGFYGIAFEIANLTASNLLAPIRRAIFPGYAKLSDDLDALRKGFVDVFALVWLIGTPFALGVGLVADPLVQVMLGASWVETIVLIQVLSLYGFLGLITAGSSPIYLATGHPRYILLTKLASIAVMLPLLVIGSARAGAFGAAWAVTISAFVEAAADFALIVHLLKLPIRGLIAPIHRPLLAAFAMAVVVHAIQAFWPPSPSATGIGALLAACVIAGGIVYIGIAWWLWAKAGYPDGAEKHVELAIRETLLRRFRTRSAI
jgi:O-antigen/teichoic acid export membrane protein